jgi:hypothetical protein
MNRTLLEPKSYDEMFTAVKLKDGSDSQYGLGQFIRDLDGHTLYEHSGEVMGFTSDNLVFPKDKLAIAVLTNQDAARGAGRIASRVSMLLLGVTAKGPLAAETQTQQLFENFQQGKIDRSLFTPWCNEYFSEQALQDFQSSLAPLGKPSSVRQTAENLRGGMTFRAFTVQFANSNKHLAITTYTEPDGKLEQYLVLPGN